VGNDLRCETTERVSEEVDPVVVEGVEDADELVGEVVDVECTANPVGLPVVAMVRDDEPEPLGKRRDHRMEVHLPIEAPAVGQHERRPALRPGLPHEELPLADEYGPPGDVDRPPLLTVVAGLAIRREEAQHEPSEAGDAQEPSNRAHKPSVRAHVGTRYAEPVARLHLHSFGDALAGVLLLHGLGSAGPVWWRVAEALADAGHSSVAPDLRGHGGSPFTGAYTLDGYAGDVLESCPAPWELVVGHSLGGAVAVRVAMLDPEFARAYLLVDPAIDFDEAAARRLRDDLAGQAARPPSVDQLTADFPGWHPGDRERKHDALIATSPDVMRASIDDNPDWHLGAELVSIDRRVHILGAELDPLYGPDDFARHGTGDGRRTFEVVLGAGHSIYRDDPDAVVRAALELLA